MGQWCARWRRVRAVFLFVSPVLAFEGQKDLAHVAVLALDILVCVEVVPSGVQVDPYLLRLGRLRGGLQPLQILREGEVAAAEELLRNPDAVNAGAKREDWMDHEIYSTSIDRWRRFLLAWDITHISVYLPGYDTLGTRPPRL